MKRKNYIFSLASALCLGAAALAMTACSSEDNFKNNLQQNAELHTYTVSIPATFGDDPAQTRAVEFDNTGATPAIATKFVENEKVYVYNVNDDELLEGYLEAKNVSADGLSCELKGTLTGTNTLVQDDKILLMYNLTFAFTDKSTNRHMTRFDYGYQQGTAATILDGATTTMMVKDIDTSDGNKLTFYAEGDGSKTQTTASFTNLQSMFRFQFSDGTDIINVQSLKITSKKNALATSYYPLNGDYTCEALTINFASATTDYIYLGLCFDPSKTADDVLVFKVTDDKGAVYSGSKAAPALGFSPVKYYYSTTATVLTKHVPPTITYTSSGDAVGNMNALTNGFDITMTNPAGVPNCIGSYYDLAAGGTLRLNNLTATYNDDHCIFFTAGDYGLSLDITGTNTITCEKSTYCFSTNSGVLKLSGNGTLTVRCKSDFQYGLHGTNYAYEPGGGFDVDQLPASGYKVTRSVPTDNGDGTCTCTYTVTPVYYAATAGDIGKVIGGNGKIYDNASAATTDGTTAEAMIAFVGNVDGECAHGLAISLTDAYAYNATFAQATGENVIPVWATAHPVLGGTWRLPTEADLQRMIWGYYVENPAGAAEATAAAKTVLTGGYYWTSTEIDVDNAKGMYYDGTTYASVQSLAKTGEWHVRACLAF